MKIEVFCFMFVLSLQPLENTTDEDKGISLK